MLLSPLFLSNLLFLDSDSPPPPPLLLAVIPRSIFIYLAYLKELSLLADDSPKLNRVFHVMLFSFISPCTPLFSCSPFVFSIWFPCSLFLVKFFYCRVASCVLMIFVFKTGAGRGSSVSAAHYFRLSTYESSLHLEELNVEIVSSFLHPLSLSSIIQCFLWFSCSCCGGKFSGDYLFSFISVYHGRIGHSSSHYDGCKRQRGC